MVACAPRPYTRLPRASPSYAFPERILVQLQGREYDAPDDEGRRVQRLGDPKLRVVVLEGTLALQEIPGGVAHGLVGEGTDGTMVEQQGEQDEGGFLRRGTVLAPGSVGLLGE